MASVVLSIIFIFILIALSGMFSATETAFLSVSKGKLQSLVKKGSSRAKLVKLLRSNMEKLIGSLLLCNNLVNIWASALATSLMMHLFGEAGVAYATLVMTMLIVLFAEVIPKFYAFRNAEASSLKLSPFIKWVVKIFWPLTLVIEKIARFILKRFKVKTDNNVLLSSSEEELRGAIDLHVGPSEEIAEEKAMLHSILDLADVYVEEIMIHRKDVFTIDASKSPTVILEEAVSSPYTRIPLWKGEPDNIIGVLHAKEFLRAIQNKRKKIDEFDILDIATKPWFIPETASLLEQLQAFKKRHEHFALVVDEYGALQGIVTLEDIIEEIVGEISDEHDVRLQGVWLSKAGDVFASGTTTIRDLNRKFNWALPDEEAATIAGLLLHETQTIPSIGQVYGLHNFRMHVIKKHKNQITLVKITPTTTLKEITPS